MTARMYLVAVVCDAETGGRNARGVFGFRTGKPLSDEAIEGRGRSVLDGVHRVGIYTVVLKFCPTTRDSL